MLSGDQDLMGPEACNPAIWFLFFPICCVGGVGATKTAWVQEDNTSPGCRWRGLSDGDSLTGTQAAPAIKLESGARE